MNRCSRCITSGRLRRDRGGEGHRPRRARGRDGHADRRQRRGQDDDPEGARRARAAAARAGALPRAGPSPEPPVHERVRRGLALVPEGRGVFRRLTVEENLDIGAYTGRDAAGVDADRERVFALFPAPRGAPAAGGRHALRRRAADARHRPGADEPAAAAAARRAEHGPGAAHGAEDLRDRARRSPAKG